jgi:hypothetical protein
MLFTLEGLCRARSYTWASNAEIAGRIGLGLTATKALLGELERAGFLWRRPINPDRPADGRAGIFLHRRLDPDRPVEDRPPPPEAVARLWAARNQSGSLVGKPTVPRPENRPPTRSENRPRNKDVVSSKNDELEKDVEHPSIQRQRPEAPPESISVPPPPPPPPPPPGPRSGLAARVAGSPVPSVGAIPPPPEAPTTGQGAFLAGLTPEQRATFDSLPPARRAELLAPHASGLDPVIRADQVRKLTGRRPAPVPTLPATTGELLAQLPGSPRAWCQAAAEAIVQDFGNSRDRKHWARFHRIAEEAASDPIAAADLVNAHDQAMRPGVRNRGAKFWAAYQALRAGG